MPEPLKFTRTTRAGDYQSGQIDWDAPLRSLVGLSNKTQGHIHVTVLGQDKV